MENLRMECDVLVAGGGIAGISAALAAARTGAKVILAEKQCALGGLATLGLITIYLPLCDGKGNQVIFGIGEELLRLSILHGAEGRVPTAWLQNGAPEERQKQRYEVQYNPYLFAILAEQRLLEAGVELLYDFHITGAVREGARICEVCADNKEGHWHIVPKMVIDATGDADLCRFAGEQTEVYTQNRFAAWNYTSGKDGVQLQMLATPLYTPLAPEERLYDGCKTADSNALIMRGHQEILAQLLEKREKTGDETRMPSAIPLVPSFRMTRRLKGAYELDESEEGKRFPDGIGLTGDWRKAGPVFSIPYRCLYGQEVENLLVAGRCISVTTPMWDITRVIPTCAVTGEAAGTAAALAVRAGVAVQALPPEVLRETLRQQGVLLEQK